MMMLGDGNENVGVAKVQAHQKQVAEENANSNDCPHELNSSLICLFNVPMLNLKANAFYELANVDSSRQQLPAIA